MEVVPIGIDVDQFSGILKLGAEGLETVVVVDVESSDRLQVETIQRAQESVGDEHALCRCDEGWEGKG